MKVLLTGITGNLGHELALDLMRRGIDIIPIIKPGIKDNASSPFPLESQEVVYSDLINHDHIEFAGKADCIIHCAGIVHFKNAGNSNEKMLLNIIDLAKRLKIPIYFVSTAFVYKAPGINNDFNNAYEKDKWQSEQVLVNSGVPHGIFRPAIMVGNSKTGEIQNFSGYYMVAQAFVEAIKSSVNEGVKLRFPRLSGKTNIVTVDQVAQCMGDIVQSGRLESLFLTNPNPPLFDWILEETLRFFGADQDIEFVNCSFEEFGKLKLTAIEEKLYQYGKHFNPYWSVDYDFPESIFKKNLIDSDYLKRTLEYFTNRQKLNNEQPSHQLQPMLGGSQSSK
ncbi:MAG: NAD-dependent epimerase/dehydratase family protein [Candidatus Staskawiczbacteria bacterium]|nr:NAD-dependent epimerase/dehydratase family protein [Candidatus Staskawiczbacteria bacterium]